MMQRITMTMIGTPTGARTADSIFDGRGYFWKRATIMAGMSKSARPRACMTNRTTCPGEGLSRTVASRGISTIHQGGRSQLEHRWSKAHGGYTTYTH